MAQSRFFPAAACALAALVAHSARAVAQAQPAPPPQPPPVVPPSTGTDLEFDPDAPKEPPPKPEEPPPLPEAPPGTWGVGGKEEEGRFAPAGKTGALEEEPGDPDDQKALDLGPPGEFSIDTVIGFGSIRDVVNDLGQTDVTVLSFVGALSYRFGETWTLLLRLPLTTASITGPQTGTEDDYNASTLGNLELTVRPSFRLTRRMRLPVWVSFYFPFAPGDAFAGPDDNVARAEYLVGLSAMAARGWEENALLAPSRIGFTPGAGLTYDRGPIHGAVTTKLEILAKSGGNEPIAPEGEPLPELRDPATNWVTGVSLFYDFLDGKLSPGLRAWLAVHQVAIAAGTRDYSGPQLVFEPSVYSKIPLNADGTLAVRAGAGVLIPVGGHLGGANDASVNGVRIKASLLF